MRVLIVADELRAKRHTLIYNALTDVEVVGFVDTQVNDAASVDGIGPGFTSLTNAISMTEPDVVDVAVGSTDCRPYVEQAAKMGKHVLCTDAFGLSVHDLDAIIHVCNETGVHLLFRIEMSEYQRGVNEVIRDQIVDSLGTIRVNRHQSILPKDGDGEYRRRGAAQALFRDIGFLIWTIGPVKRVYAKHTGRTHLPYHLSASLLFTNGVIGHVVHTFIDGGSSYVKIESTSNTRMVEFSTENFRAERADIRPLPPCSDDADATLSDSLAGLIQCLQRDAEASSEVRHVRNQISTFWATERSLETHSPIYVNEV